MDISFGAVQSILANTLSMSKVSSRCVPQMLTNDLKRTSLIFLVISGLTMKMILTILLSELYSKNETWVHHFDPQSKMQNKRWKHPSSPPSKKFKSVHSAGKVMASIFWDASSPSVIMIDYLEVSRTINSVYYAGEMRQLCQEIARKRRGKLTRVFCSCRTMPLLRLNVDLNSFLIPHILLIWLLLTSIVPKTETPSSWYTVGKQ